MSTISRMFAVFNGLLKNELDAGGNRITNLAEPTADSDAATRKYVSEHGGGTVQWKDVQSKPAWVDSDTKPAYNGEEVTVSSTDTTTLAAKIAAIIKSIPAAVTKTTVLGWGFLEATLDGLKKVFVVAETGKGLASVSEGDTGNTITAPNAAGMDVAIFVPKKDTSLSVSGAYADAKTVGEKLSLRATVADLGNGVFRIADEAVDTTTTEVLY